MVENDADVSHAEILAAARIEVETARLRLRCEVGIRLELARERNAEGRSALHRSRLGEKGDGSCKQSARSGAGGDSDPTRTRRLPSRRLRSEMQPRREACRATSGRSSTSGNIGSIRIAPISPRSAILSRFARRSRARAGSRARAPRCARSSRLVTPIADALDLTRVRREEIERGSGMTPFVRMPTFVPRGSRWVSSACVRRRLGREGIAGRAQEDARRRGKLVQVIHRQRDGVSRASSSGAPRSENGQ